MWPDSYATASTELPATGGCWSPVAWVMDWGYCLIESRCGHDVCAIRPERRDKPHCVTSWARSTHRRAWPVRA